MILIFPAASAAPAGVWGEAAAEDFGLVILKSVTENGEELLTTLDSDEELQRVYDLFMEQLMDEDDENS